MEWCERGLLCRKYWAERGRVLLCRKCGAERGERGRKSARAREDENARARERLRGKKRGGKCGVRMREGKMMEEQGSVEQVRGAGEVCWGMWEENKKARMRESTGGKVL